MWASKYVFSGTPSGQIYEISAGEVVPVQRDDLDFLLGTRRVVGGCCGSPRQEIKILELVK